MADLNCEIAILPWFHKSLNRHQAEALLLQNGQDGSYLLRESCTSPGEYSLSVRCEQSVKHFQIGWNGKNYQFGMGKFSSLDEFIKHFENRPLIGGESGILTLLKYPYPYNVEEPEKYDEIRIHAEWGKRMTVEKDKVSLNETESINSKEGYLTKQGGNVKNWKARWFVLIKNELKYFKFKADKLPIRTLDMTKCLAVEEDDSMGKKNLIRIDMPGRTFYVYASTESEKDEWLNILRWKVRRNSKDLS